MARSVQIGPDGLPVNEAPEEEAPPGLPIIAPDGSEGFVPQEDYRRALEAGYQIPVIAPDGTLGSIPGADREAAFADGYRLVPELEDANQEFLYGNRPLEAAAAGSGRSLSLGLSDLALAKSGLVEPETLKGLKERNKAATIVGEVGGMAAGALIPGVGAASALGLAGKVGHAAAHGAKAVGIAGMETFGKRMVGKAVAGFAEGALFGAGNAVSEYAMGDPDLNAQKVIAEIGLGGLLGAGVSGLAGLAEEGVRAAGPKVGELLGTLQKRAEAARDVRTVKATGAIQSDINKLSDERVAQIAKDVFDSGAVPMGAGPKEILAATKKGAREQWKKAESILKEADNSAVFDIRKVTERGRAEVLSEIAGDPALAGEARKVERLLKGYEKLVGEGEGVAFSMAQKLDSGLRKSIKGKIVGEAEKSSVEKLRSIFREELGTQLKSGVGEKAAGEFENAMRLYGSFAEAKKWGMRGVKRMQGNRLFSITDQGLGAGVGLLTGGPMGIATGVAGAVANKVLRERGSSVAANVLDRISKSETLTKLAEHFAYAVKQAQPAVLGEFAPVLASAAARSSKEALATHIALARTNPAYREAAAMAGWVQESTEQAAHAAQKMHALSGVQKALEHHGERVGHMVEKAMHGSAEHKPASKALASQEFGTKRMRRERVAAHKKHTEDVARLAGNPVALADRVAENLGGFGSVAPAMAAAAGATAARAVTFLASKLPQHNASQGPLAHEWEPSATEIAAFNAYSRAVQNPHSVLEDAAAGTLTPEAVEAVKAVYPKLFEQIQAEVLDQLTDGPEVPYRQRVMLSILLGLDPDGSLAPDMILRNQQTLSGPSQKNPEDQPGPMGQVKPTAKGAQSLTVSQRSMTSLDATASRED